MSNEAVTYVYQNVGVTPDRALDETTAYVYQNVGNRARSRLGAVYGLSAPQHIPVVYVYQNVT